MYSPKIREDLVQRLYLIAKQKRIPMTLLVNGYIEEVLNDKRYGNITKSNLLRKNVYSTKDK